ncbi:hypothetical protein SAMN05444166_3252 [Singulisphaera sp. GP187]|uniref:hypothetical protein n=1 Tax=Singulisphaera sp. GP187 TaxID=1882752 RepID=UPI0009265938|nr:hypothetical protein [Singulisphaera sp. GP187]SIO25148.1 hypothetical protein SAMN05444166_3252 [Singulisphaera sp. GP187]
MTLPRRSKPSRAWHVEQLEDRALLTTVYGPAPANLDVASTSFSPSLWRAPWIDATSAADRGQFAMGTTNPNGLTLSLRTKDMLQARSAFFFSRGNLSFESPAIEFGTSDVYNVIQITKPVRIPGEMEGAAPPFFGVAIRGLPGVPPGRGPFGVTSSNFGRSRDDIEGGPARFGGSRLSLLVISPESYWENGIIGKSSEELFAFAGTGSSSEARSASSPHTEPTSNEAEAHGQAQASSNSAALSPGSSIGNVMIWVGVDAWSSDPSISSILLSRGDFEPGALFPQDDLPELSALLTSLLNEWLDDTAEISLPLTGQLQQITKLDPLDESSLALTATLLTVSSAPQPPSTTAGPGSTENLLTEASLPVPPSWAGFVIGLDEAFEANRLATRRWPSGPDPQAKAGPRDEANEAARTIEQSAADRAIQDLDQAPPPRDAVDALFLPLPGEIERDSTEREIRLAAAARASLSLAIVPALWAERLRQLPRRRRERLAPGDRAKD